MTLNRRKFAGGLAAVSLAAASCGPGQKTAAAAVEEDEDIRNFIAEALNEGVETGTTSTTTDLPQLRANPALLISVGAVKTEVATGALKATPLDDADAVDYAHIVRNPEFGADGAFSQQPFPVDDALLRSIVASGSFGEPLKDKQTIVFGLRGCELLEGDRASGTAIQVREARIDHVDPHCLLGIWRPGTKDIALFTASTVPNLVNMQMFLFYHFSLSGEAPAGVKVEAITCGLLPQGLHTYKVGTHRPNDGTDRQPGCLRQDSPSPVMRARNMLQYGLGELWDPLHWRPAGKGENSVRVTNNNIHSATNKNSPPFASAGCQTLPGRYDPKPTTAIGVWSAFQAALGITINPGGNGSNLDGTPFSYLLTTGREARLLSQYAGNAAKLQHLRRLRIGSAGAPAAKLRKALFGEADTGNTLDGLAIHELIRKQDTSWGVPRDGMWTPLLDEARQVRAWQE